MKNTEKTYEVYKITNKVNGKIYVGITNQGYKTRWYKHCSDAIHDSSFPIHQALRKYGFDNFKVGVIEQCSTIDLLKEREKFWIKELGTLTKYGKGYNITTGGDGAFGRYHSDETKELLRELALNRKEVNDEARLKMSLNSVKAKIVSQFTLDGELIKTYRSAREAARQLGLIATNISACARGKYKHSGGFKWSYTDEVITDPVPKVKLQHKVKKVYHPTDEVKQRISETNKKHWVNNPERHKQASLNNPKNRSILQYTLAGEFIKEFRSVSEAVKEVGASTHTNIAKCARRERKKSCGYIWKYK